MLIFCEEFGDFVDISLVIELSFTACVGEVWAIDWEIVVSLSVVPVVADGSVGRRGGRVLIMNAEAFIFENRCVDGIQIVGREDCFLGDLRTGRFTSGLLLLFGYVAERFIVGDIVDGSCSKFGSGRSHRATFGGRIVESMVSLTSVDV